MWNSCDPNLEDDTNDVIEDFVNDDSVSISTNVRDDDNNDKDWNDYSSLKEL